MTMEFSVGAWLERGSDLFYLMLLAAMIYAGVAWWRRTRGTAALILSWAAGVAALSTAARIGGVTIREGLRSLEEAQETPKGPWSYESWALLGSLAELVGGVALLGCGLALIFHGWGEGKRRAKGARGGGSRR